MDDEQPAPIGGLGKGETPSIRAAAGVGTNSDLRAEAGQAASDLADAAESRRVRATMDALAAAWPED